MIAYPTILLAIVISILFLLDINTAFHLSAFYIVVLVIGFIATLILGQFYKTLPFIVWLKIYKPFVGKEKTLLPKDLYSYKRLKFQYYFHVIGFLIFFGALLSGFTAVFYLGLGLLFIAAVLFLINVMQIVLHKKQTL